jgi:hypothetical protein
LNIQKKILDMKLLSKEMLINAGVTLAVVMVALYVHDKFVAPKMASEGSAGTED